MHCKITAVYTENLNLYLCTAYMLDDFATRSDIWQVFTFVEIFPEIENLGGRFGQLVQVKLKGSETM